MAAIAQLRNLIDLSLSDCHLTSFPHGRFLKNLER